MLKIKDQLDYTSGIKKISDENKLDYNLLGTGWDK